MSGFWRNLLTMLMALLKRDSAILQTGCSCNFWVTPFDVGVRTLKSDKYLQFAEAAQLDFGVRSGLLGRMRQAHCAMVNVEQRIQFTQPSSFSTRFAFRQLSSLPMQSFCIFSICSPSGVSSAQASWLKPNSKPGASRNQPQS